MDVRHEVYIGAQSAGRTAVVIAKSEGPVKQPQTEQEATADVRRRWSRRTSRGGGLRQTAHPLRSKRAEQAARGPSTAGRAAEVSLDRRRAATKSPTLAQILITISVRQTHPRHGAGWHVGSVRGGMLRTGHRRQHQSSFRWAEVAALAFSSSSLRTVDICLSFSPVRQNVLHPNSQSYARQADRSTGRMPPCGLAGARFSRASLAPLPLASAPERR